MRRKHACEHCRHEPNTILAELVGFPDAPREVPKHEWEVEVPVVNVDGPNPLAPDADPDLHLDIYTLVFERYKPLDYAGSRWQFKFRGVRHRG